MASNQLTTIMIKTEWSWGTVKTGSGWGFSLLPPHRIVFNVSPFDSTTLAIAKNNARSHLMCITRAAPAWFEWSELFKLFDWVEFCQRLFFEPKARKIILQNSTKSKSLKCKPNSKIKQVLLWWYTLSGCGHCFSRWPNLASKKDDTFDILLTSCTPCLMGFET